MKVFMMKEVKEWIEVEIDSLYSVNQFFSNRGDTSLVMNLGGDLNEYVHPADLMRLSYKLGLSIENQIQKFFIRLKSFVYSCYYLTEASVSKIEQGFKIKFSIVDSEQLQ